MSAASSPALEPRAQAPAGAEAPARGLERSLALGWLALLPLVAVYEAALLAVPGSPRNTAEYLISLPVELVAPRAATAARLLLEAGVTALCVGAVFHAELGLARRVLRVALEGVLASLALGPLLLVLLSAFGAAPPALGRPSAVPAPAAAAVLAGGAAFEEVVFRVGLLWALAALARKTLEWHLGLPRAARVLAEAVAVLGGAFVFAAAHLAPVVGLVAQGGEPYDGARFAWRFCAGALLALLYRWRGVGVAAWTHACFNLALLLGAGPEVFL